MISLPIPIVTAILLIVLALSKHQQLKSTATGRTFAMILYLNALAMALVGLRWSFDWAAIMPLVAILSVSSLSLIYLAFRSLGQQGPVITLPRDWLHAIPTLFVILTALIPSTWTDVTVITTKLVYLVLLIQLARMAPDSLQFVRLNWFKNTQQALWGVVALLVVGLIVDVAIVIDFVLYEGRHSASLVGSISLLILIILGWASVQAAGGRGQDTDSTPDPTSDPDSVPSPGATLAPEETGHETLDENKAEQSLPTDANVMKTLNTLLIDNKLYADTELNLQRLARKAGVSPRIVSKTINAHTGQNLSQWVNSARIDAACELLTDPNKSVNAAMENSGFLTKSNFNREFRRLKGCSPSEWRVKGS